MSVFKPKQRRTTQSRGEDGATITCPYCRNSVIVPAELHPDRPAAIPHDRLDELFLPQIRNLLSRSQKIEAIKLVRQHFPAVQTPLLWYNSPSCRASSPGNLLPERRPPLNTRAFIFDLDGVLANTEPLAFKAWQELVDPTGVIMDDADYLAMLGTDAEGTADFIFHRTGLVMAADAMVADHWRRMKVLIDAELEPTPGTADLLAELARRGCRLAVASNSPTDYVLHVLEKVRLRSAFEAVVGRDQVQNGKPDPEPYLEAAHRVGCDPQDCVAVEDSPLGLRAAINAGMRCLAITPDGKCQNGHSQALACFTSMQELYDGIDIAFK